jgi:hypothetical protein
LRRASRSVNFAPVANGQHEYNQPLPFDPHDDAPIVNAVSPQAGARQYRRPVLDTGLGFSSASFRKEA